MRKLTKIWLIIATFLIVIGGSAFTVALAASGWDFTNLSTVEYVSNTHLITESFSAISIETDVADIAFVATDDDNYRVECYEFEKAQHAVSIDNGTLVVKVVNTRQWFDYISINFGTPKITVYLPRQDFDTIRVVNSTGDIRIENLAANMMDLTVSTGDISVSNVSCYGDIKTKTTTGKIDINNVTCNNFYTEGSTGDITLRNVIADQVLNICRTTGDVTFNDCDANSLTITTDTGDVSGSLLSGKTFTARTSTGDIHVPDNTFGGTCAVTTSTGDINITVN